MPPNQLLLLTDFGAPSEPHSAECELHPAECETGAGQLELPGMPTALVSETPSRHANASGAIGDEGERRFEGLCRAAGLIVWTAPVGLEGKDHYVNGWLVQVKSTADIRDDGRLGFKAGKRRRFANYRGHADLFAFFYVGPNPTYCGRMLVLTINEVLNRCPGPTFMLHPDELLKEPDLSKVMQTRD